MQKEECNKMITSRERKEECITQEQQTFPRTPKPTLKDKLQLGKLLSIKRVEQRTPEWYELRMTMITASDWATAIGEGHFNKKEDFILKKCGKGPKFRGNIYTEWGVKYEDVAVRLYELRNKTKVYEFGVLKHPKYPFLGASPDGITVKGIMLEIKCPYSRKITGIVPRHYWIQIQGQLEVCDLSYCDFLECKIVEYSGINEYIEDTEENPPLMKFDVNENLQEKYENDRVFLRTKDCMEKGAIITFNTPEGENRYFHSELGVSKEEFEEWHVKVKKEVPHNWVERRVTFWRFDLISCVRVERDPNWFRETLPKLQETWNQVEHYKNIGCDSLLKKTNKDDVDEADMCEINALVNSNEGYDDIADAFLDTSSLKSYSNGSMDEPMDEFDIPDSIVTSLDTIIIDTEKKSKGKEIQVSETKASDVKMNLKPNNVMLHIKSVQRKTKVIPPSPTMSRRSELPDNWTVEQLEAIFELELGSWILPKYIPLNPVVVNERSIEEFKMNLAGTCKIASRCKTALVRLVKCPAETFDESEINIRHFAHQVNNWMTGMSSFLKDLMKSLEFEISKDLKKSIKAASIVMDKWTNKLYPKWVSKWEESDDEESDEESNESSE